LLNDDSSNVWRLPRDSTPIGAQNCSISVRFFFFLSLMVAFPTPNYKASLVALSPLSMRLCNSNISFNEHELCLRFLDISMRWAKRQQ
jgi:hypothetical protein